MKRQMNKEYTIEVGVDYPWVGYDDTFEIQAEITEQEKVEIVQGGIQIIHKDRCELTPEEYIEAFSESAYGRLNAIAEKVAVEKWGEKMLIDNGARYDFFLPKEIMHAIFGSEEAKNIYEKRIQQENLSRSGFRKDATLLRSNQVNGRWGGLLLPAPTGSNQYFDGVWKGTPVVGYDNYSAYEIHCRVMVEDTSLEIGYSVEFHLDHIKFELSVYNYNHSVFRCFEDILNREGYIVKGTGCGCAYTQESYSELSDPMKYVKTYMNVLDEVIKLCFDNNVVPY